MFGIRHEVAGGEGFRSAVSKESGLVLRCLYLIKCF